MPETPQPVQRGLDTAFLTDADDATELVLVRHGQQEAPPFGHGAVGDHVDAPLSERGRRQAALVGERFRNERVDVVYASNLQRAFDTAAAIAGHHGLEPIVETDLREIEFFRDLDPEARPIDVFGRRRLVGMRAQMARDQRWDAYPCTEPSLDFRRRVVNAVEGILFEHEGQRVVIGCHGGVIATYLGWMLGIDRDMWARPGHASVHVVKARGTVRALHGFNDVTHLRSVDPGLVTY